MTTRPTVDVFPHTNYVANVAVVDDPELAAQQAQDIGGGPSLSAAALADRQLTKALEQLGGRNDQTGPSKLRRMKQRYDRQQGPIASAEGVVLVNIHNHPHVMLLQHKKTELFRLPGGKCRFGEDPVDCLRRKLSRKLQGGAPVGEQFGVGPDGAVPGQQQQQLFRVTELLAEWIRPNFDPLMYPYRPAHVTKEKEVRHIYLVQLAPEGAFAVRPDFESVAVPLFELHDNAAKYGSVIASIPQAISRLHINLC